MSIMEKADNFSERRSDGGQQKHARKSGCLAVSQADELLSYERAEATRIVERDAIRQTLTPEQVAMLRKQS